IGCPCLFGRYGGAVVKCSRLRSSCYCRLALVHRNPLLRVSASSLRMLSLSGYRRDMFLVCRGLILGGRTRGYPPAAAVVADPVHCRIVDRGVIRVVNVGDVHVVHRTVVVKLSVLPTSTFITLTEVAIAIIDSAIETYVRTPVAFIESIHAVAPAPIAWGPEKTDLRSHHPRTWHPIVITIGGVVSPVPRRPDIALGGEGWLLVHGQRRRGDANRYADLRERGRRHGQHYEREQQRTNGGNDMQCASSCPVILGLPGDALLPRVAQMERHDFRTKRTAHFVSLANGSAMSFSFSGILCMVKNAQF